MAGVTDAGNVLRPTSGGPTHEAGRAPRDSVSEMMARSKGRRPATGCDESSGQGLFSQDAQYEMGDRHHVYPYRRRLALSGRHLGFMFSSGDWVVVDATAARLRGGDPSRADGGGPTDHSWYCGPALGSGNAVYGPGSIRPC